MLSIALISIFLVLSQLLDLGKRYVFFEKKNLTMTPIITTVHVWIQARTFIHSIWYCSTFFKKKKKKEKIYSLAFNPFLKINYCFILFLLASTKEKKWKFEFFWKGVINFFFSVWLIFLKFLIFFQNKIFFFNTITNKNN